MKRQRSVASSLSRWPMASSRCNLLFKVGVGIPIRFPPFVRLQTFYCLDVLADNTHRRSGAIRPAARDSRHPSRHVGPRCAGGDHRDQCGHPRRKPFQSPAWLDGLRPDVRASSRRRAPRCGGNPGLIGRAKLPRRGATWAKCARRAAISGTKRRLPGSSFFTACRSPSDTTPNPGLAPQKNGFPTTSPLPNACKSLILCKRPLLSRKAWPLVRQAALGSLCTESRHS